MLERTALLKLAPAHASAENRRTIAQRALAVLRPLPGVQAVTVGIAADDDTAAAWDVCITARFANAADAASYRAHPEHRRFADEFIAPQCEARKAWSFEIESR